MKNGISVAKIKDGSSKKKIEFNSKRFRLNKKKIGCISFNNISVCSVVLLRQIDDTKKICFVSQENFF